MFPSRQFYTIWTQWCLYQWWQNNYKVFKELKYMLTFNHSSDNMWLVQIPNPVLLGSRYKNSTFNYYNTHLWYMYITIIKISCKTVPIILQFSTIIDFKMHSLSRRPTMLKIPSYQSRNCRYKHKTVVLPSFRCSGDPYTWIITLVRHKKAQFDSNMLGSTQICPVRHKNAPTPACISWYNHYQTSHPSFENFFFQFYSNILFLRTHR